jgi:hypothetical protein
LNNEINKINQDEEKKRKKGKEKYQNWGELKGEEAI